MIPSGAYALCAERADFYRDTYVVNTTTATTVQTGSWDKWSRRAGGPWQGPTTDARDNEYNGTYGWRAQADATLWLTLDPSVGGYDELLVEDGATTLCDADDCALSIRVGPTRELVCGF